MLERWRERRRLRALARQPRRGRGLELLRGPADRQRPPRLPPRPRPRLQGRLPALQDDVRLPGAAQGGLGLPRPAGRARGRKAARHRLQAGDRGVRDRRVQPALPRVGLRVRRGVEPADRADRLLDRPRRPLRHPRGRLHRVGLVVAEASTGTTSRLYEGHKVVPYCPRDGTPLSSHEVAQGYKDVEDPSIYVRFPLLDGDGASAGESLLVWTTTPWTLPGNVAVAVAPERHLRARPSVDGETLILAEPLVEKVLGEGVEIARPLPRRRPGRPPLRRPGLRRSPTAAPSAARRPSRSSPATSSPPRTAPASSTSPRPSARTTTGSRPRTGSSTRPGARRSTTRSSPTATSTTASPASPAASSRTPR